MRRQIIAAVCLAALGFTLGSISAFAQKKAARGKEAAETQAAQGPKVYTTIKDLMDSIVDPSADVVWGAVEPWSIRMARTRLFRRHRRNGSMSGARPSGSSREPTC